MDGIVSGEHLRKCSQLAGIRIASGWIDQSRTHSESSIFKLLVEQGTRFGQLLFTQQAIVHTRNHHAQIRRADEARHVETDAVRLQGFEKIMQPRPM